MSRRRRPTAATIPAPIVSNAEVLAQIPQVDHVAARTRFSGSYPSNGTTIPMPFGQQGLF